MATISVKLKAIVDKDTKKKIDEAHKIFNENVRVFEEFFLLAQCKDYYFDNNEGVEEYCSKEKSDLLMKELIKQYPNADYSICKKSLLKLREVIKDKGSQAAGMLAKLYKEDSTAGTNNIAKIVRPEPEWVQYFNTSSKSFDTEEHKRLADEWILSEQGQEDIKPSLVGSGRPSAFKQAYSSGKEWYEAFIKDQIKYKKDLDDGLSRVLCDLENERILPVIKLQNQLVEEFPIWVKLYLKTALENYASYVECDDSTREDYDIALHKYEEAKRAILEKEDIFEKLDRFLKENYISSEHSVYLTSRMCRGLESIYYEWKKCPDQAERIAVLNRWQSDREKKRKIGDVNFLTWLAQDDNYIIYDKKCIEELLEYYSALKDVESKRKCASYTTADPILSKRYLFSEHPKGSNYRKYELSSQSGMLTIKIPVLLKNTEGLYYEEVLTLPLANNKQFQPPFDEIEGKAKDIQFIESKKEVEVIFSNGKRSMPFGSSQIVEESFIGKLGGADLRVDYNGNNEVKDVFVSIPLTVQETCLKSFRETGEIAMYHFGTAYNSKKTKHSIKLNEKRIRALSVDLGLKQLCAAAVGMCDFDEDKMIQDYKIERQFMLRLPGEKCSTDIDRHRKEANYQIKKMRTAVNYLSMLKRIYNIEDLDRCLKLIDQNVKYTHDYEKNEFFKRCIFAKTKADLDILLEEEYSRYISEMNIAMHDFRGGLITKKQKRDYEPGKSFWSIGYLEDIRKLLLAWNSLGYSISEDNRQMNSCDSFA